MRQVTIGELLKMLDTLNDFVRESLQRPFGMSTRFTRREQDN